MCSWVLRYHQLVVRRAPCIHIYICKHTYKKLITEHHIHIYYNRTMKPHQLHASLCCKVPYIITEEDHLLT